METKLDKCNSVKVNEKLEFEKVEVNREEEEELNVLLSPRKGGIMSNGVAKNSRKKVQWNDRNGDKLFEILEFQPRRNLGPNLPMTKRALLLGHLGSRLMGYLQGMVISSPWPREGQETLPRNAGRFYR
ncbi:hypothetical protein GIB67_037595 [Kingdonia uniflora]|uniref:Uncharacterized protein n=1 Tax=Kingdonia uniflora TaxID=39325 RepID=A0A7J7LSP8_9MAGN|nr:hypothetical protein GIB67_037595 [Kingdonia uniflora]